jgi:hypothetical protein
LTEKNWPKRGKSTTLQVSQIANSFSWGSLLLTL